MYTQIQKKALVLGNCADVRIRNLIKALRTRNIVDVVSDPARFSGPIGVALVCFTARDELPEYATSLLDVSTRLKSGLLIPCVFIGGRKSDRFADTSVLNFAKDPDGAYASLVHILETYAKD